jgi:predicted permease
MSWRRALNRLAALVRRRRIEDDLAEEIRIHLQMEEEENRAAGMSPERAWAAARRSFGNVTAAQERSREMWIYRALENAAKDVRYALRRLRKSPGFTAVAVLTLALGVGANTAIFTLLDQILLRLLPVKAPQALVLLTMRGSHYGDNWGANAISHPMFRDFQRHNEVFSGMFCRFQVAMNLTVGGRAERVEGELVSGTYFDVLGVGAALGRTIAPDDDRVAGGHPVAVLSHDYWRVRFGADPTIVGKTVLVNDRTLTVIGVAQRGFDGVELGHATKLFVPVMMDSFATGRSDMLTDRRTRWVNAFGRLKPGITAVQAQASLQPFMHAMLEREVREAAFSRASQSVKERFLRSWIELLPGSQGRMMTRRQLSTPLWVLMATTGFVLLIACANLANLLLARSTARRKEIAVRLAIGASRGRLVRQLLVESLVLSTLGGLCGLAVAFLGAEVLMAVYLPPDSAGLNVSTAPDQRVLLFALGTTFLTGIGFGLAPALRSTKTDVTSALKDQTAAVIGGRARLRNALVVVQVTLSLVLLIGAGLFVRSLGNLRALGPGFPTAHLIGFQLNPWLSGYVPDRSKLFYRQLTDELAAIPGVQSVGLAAMRILENDEWDSGMTVEGYTPAGPADNAQPFMNQISPGYFATLGVPLVAGRDFTAADNRKVTRGSGPDSSPTVAIINEAFARRFFAGRNPIGMHVGFGTNPGASTPMEVIGVVKDIKYMNLRDEVPVQAFIPYLGSDFVGTMTVYLRTTDPVGAISAARERVAKLDSTMPIYAVRSMDAQINGSLANERMIATLSSVFGGLATLLAILGLYGVMSYTVAQRTREIGIRMALGAARGSVVSLVMREVGLLVAVGVTAGVAASLALTRLVQSQLYGLGSRDPVTLLLATVGLGLVACAAGYFPALRASRVDPMVALRAE